jgi:hypothetical protein
MFGNKVTPELRETINKICTHNLTDLLRIVLKELGKEDDFDNVLDNFAGAGGIAMAHRTTCKWLEKVFASYLNSQDSAVTESVKGGKRVIVVDSVPYSRFMNAEARRMVDSFNASGEKLKLIVMDHYKNKDLEDILDQGMYEYDCSDKQLIEMLYEMVDFASAVGWDVEDVIQDTMKPEGE